jgi:hypothetical protein
LFSHLEGRKFTEILVALSTSFIVSSGVVKSVGLFVMALWDFLSFDAGDTGSLFVLPLLFFFCLVIEKIPNLLKKILTALRTNSDDWKRQKKML